MKRVGPESTRRSGYWIFLQIAVQGLKPGSAYQVYLAESNHAPFGKLEPLAILKTNSDGAGIVQTLGPLKLSFVKPQL